MNTILPSSLLRTGLRLDAVLSLAAAVAVVLLLEPLTSVFGVAREHLIGSVAFMVGWAAITGWMGAQPRLPVWSVWLSISVNIEWAVASLLLPSLGWISPTPIGWGVLIAQMAGVLLFAELQWLGLQRSRRNLPLIADANAI